MKEENLDINRIERKHYLIGALILALAFTLQPFSLLATQVFLAPAIAPYILGDQQQEQELGDNSAAGKTISTENLKITGNKDAQILLVEFSDYECPFCQRFHEVPKAILEKYEGKVAWVWKHYPLSFHPNATPAAVSAECVNKLSGQENFWKYSDVLINNQNSLSDSFYKKEAAKLGIDSTAFATCLKDKQVESIVSSELEEGSNLGVQGTPNTFIVKNENGTYTILETISGALPESSVDNVISKYIQ